MSQILEALERQLAFGSRRIPRESSSKIVVAFVVERETSAPEESRNKDFVDSVARALDLLPGQYVLTYPERVPEARLWVFLGDLPVFEVKADKLIKTEVVGKLVESVALKKELWLRLKALKESGLLTL